MSTSQQLIQQQLMAEKAKDYLDDVQDYNLVKGQGIFKDDTLVYDEQGDPIDKQSGRPPLTSKQYKKITTIGEGSAAVGKAVESEANEKNERFKKYIADILRFNETKRENYDDTKKKEKRTERDDIHDRNRMLEELKKTIRGERMAMQQTTETYKLPPDSQSYDFVKLIQLANQNAYYQQNLFNSQF